MAREVCQKMEQKFQNGGTDFPAYENSVRQCISETDVDVARATGLILENRRFKIRGLFTAMNMSIRNVDTFFHGEMRVTISYVDCKLVLFHRVCTQHCTRTTGYQQICVFLSNGTMLPDGRGHNPRFETAV
jgi:hypothetical protein